MRNCHPEPSEVSLRGVGELFRSTAKGVLLDVQADSLLGQPLLNSLYFLFITDY